MEILIQLFWVFLKIGFFSFGGGYTMLPLIEAEVIERGWISVSEFIDIIAVAEMTPGTIAVNSATFIGYRIAGISGSLLATTAVITPSILILLLFGHTLLRLKDNRHNKAVLKGLRPAFISLIAMAGVFIGQNSLTDYTTWLIFTALFFIILLRKISPFIVLAAGAVLGLVFFPY